MDVPQSFVAKLEKGISDPRLSTVLRYALIVLGGTALLAVLLAAIEDLSRGGGPRGSPPA